MGFARRSSRSGAIHDHDPVRFLEELEALPRRLEITLALHPGESMRPMQIPSAISSHRAAGLGCALLGSSAIVRRAAPGSGRGGLRVTLATHPY